MYTLVAICGCCGEPNVILKSDDKPLLEKQKSDIEDEIQKWMDEHDGKLLLEAVGIKHHSEFYGKITEILNKPDVKEPKLQARLDVLKSLANLVGDLVIDIAPKYFGMNLHII